MSCIISDYKIEKKILQSAEVPRRPKVIIPTPLCCLKPLFIKTCRMRAITVAIRKKQEAPKVIPIKGFLGTRWGAGYTSTHQKRLFWHFHEGFFFFNLSQTSYKSSTLLKLRAKPRDRGLFFTRGQRKENSSLWIIVGSMDHHPCREVCGPHSHQPAGPEQKEQEFKVKIAGLTSQGYQLLPPH